jgi:hypothetical protein
LVSFFLSATGGEADFILVAALALGRAEGKARATKAEGCKPGRRGRREEPDETDRAEHDAEGGNDQPGQGTDTGTAATTGCGGGTNAENHAPATDEPDDEPDEGKRTQPD